MKVRILFYRARFGKPLDMLISLWTAIWNWGTEPYSHVEFWEASRIDGFEVATPLPPLYTKYVGWCATSTIRDKINGVCRRLADFVLRHPGRWDYCEIEIKDRMADTYGSEAVRDFWDAKLTGNTGYDLWGILGFALPWGNVGAKDKYYCSEIVGKALVVAGVIKDFDRVSPRRLSRWLIKTGYEIKPLVERTEK